MPKNLIVARFTRKFIKGNLVGIVHHDSLEFVNVKAADRWLAAINASKTLEYVITDFYIENPQHA